MTTFYGARSDHCPLALPCQIDLSDENLKYTTIVSERKDLLMTRGVSIQGSLYPGESLSGGGGSLCPGESLSRRVSVQESLCPGESLSSRGLCPGVFVWGSLSRGLSPEEVSVQSWSLSRGGRVSLWRPLPESEKWAVRILLECFFVI